MGSAGRRSGNSSNTASNNNVCCSSTAASDRNPCGTRRSGGGRSSHHPPVEVHRLMYRKDNALSILRRWPPESSSPGAVTAWHVHESCSSLRSTRRCRSEEAKQTQPCFSLMREMGCTGEWIWSRKTSFPTRMSSSNVHSIPGLALASAAAAAAAASTDHATTHTSQAALAAGHLSADFPAATAVFSAAASQTPADAAVPAAHGKPASGAHVCKKQQRLHSQPLVFSCIAGQHTGGAAAAAAAASATSGGGAAQRSQDPKNSSGSSNRGEESTEGTDTAALRLGLTSKSTCLSFLPHTASAVCSSSKERRNVCSSKAGTGYGTPAGTAAAAAARACGDLSVAGASDPLTTANAVVSSSVNGAAVAYVNHGRRAAAVVDSEGAPPTPADASAWFLAPTCTAAVGPAAVCCTSQQRQEGAAAPTQRGGEKDNVGGFVVACSLSEEEEQEERHRTAGEAPAGKRAAGGGGAAAAATEMCDKEGDGGGGGQASATRAHATEEVYVRGGGAAWRRLAADEIAAASPVASGEASRPPPAGRSRLRRQLTGRTKRHTGAANEEGEGGGGPVASTEKAHEMKKSWGIGSLMWTAKRAARTALPPQASLQQNAFLQQPQKQRQRQQRRLQWAPGDVEELEEFDEEEKEEEKEEGGEVGEAYGSETSGRLREGRKNREAETYWSLLQELLIRVRRSSSYGAQSLLLLGEDFRGKLLQQKVRLESSKRLSGRCFFYLLLTFFLVLLALVLLLGTLQHQHKLYRLRPRQVLLLQQHTQRQMQQRMQQQQEQQQRQGDPTDGACQQRFFEILLHLPVPSLRPCPHGATAGTATAQEKWRPYSAAAAPSACVSGEEGVCCRGTPELDKSYVSSQQSCPKTEEDTALLAPASAATAADAPEDKRRRLPLSMAMHSSLSLTRTSGHPARTTSFTSRNASVWRGTDMLGVCCVPLAVSPYSSATYCKEDHGVQCAASPAEAANTTMCFTGTHVVDDGFSASRVCGPPPAAAVPTEAYTNTFVSAGDLSGAAAAAAHTAFPRNVFFFSLHGHPPPLSFLDPASPVLVCAEADERQLLLRLLLQLMHPFRAASDALHALLQRLRFYLGSLSTTQQQNHQSQLQQAQQEHNKQQEQSRERQQSNQGETLQRRGVVSAAVQEDAAAVPCSGTSCCAVASAGGVCNNILEEAAAAGEGAASAAAAEDGLAASDKTKINSPWERQILHVLANGSSACCCCSCPAADASSPWMCGQVPDKLAAPVLSQEAKLGPATGTRPPAAVVRSLLQEKADETTAPGVLLSRLCEAEEPRLQVYAQTLRASFNGLLPRYIQMRFAALSAAAAFPSTLHGNAASGASPAAVGPMSAAASSRLAMTQRGRDAFFSAFSPVSVAAPTPVTVGLPYSLGNRFLVSPTAGAHSSSGIPPAAPGSPPPYAGGAADGAAASSFLLPGASFSSVLLTRLRSLLPADTSIYFSFSSYLSPCYPFSRFLHRRLVGWGGLQLHILLFGGWFHSLFAAEPLTLVHAPRALFLFVLACYRGLILYEAFSSLEAHYFRRADTLQQQEHLRAAATAAAAAAEEDATGKHSGGSAGRRRGGGEKRESAFCEDILFERDDLQLLEQQGVGPASMKAGHDSSYFGSSGSSSGYPVRGERTTVNGEAEKKEQVEEGEKQQQQQHRSGETGENETGRRRKSCSRAHRHTEEEGEIVAAAAWTDFSDHVVLYVLVAIFAAMEIAAARSSHTRLRMTPAAGSSSNTRNPAVCCTCSSSSSTKACSSGCCCSSGASSSGSSSVSSSSEHRSNNSRCGGNKLARGRGDAVPPGVGDTSSTDSRCPSSTLTTLAGTQYYQETLQRAAPRANGFSSAAAVHQLQSTTAGDVATAAKPGELVVAAGGSAAATAAPAPVAYLSQPCTNNSCGTEAPGRQSGTGKLYLVVWIYYGFLLLCCFHMAFYTACFFHTPQEIWSGLGVGLVFLVLPLVIACEVLEKPTLQRLGIGSGEKRAAKQATSAAEAVACGGGAVGGASSSREPTGSCKRFTDAEEAEIALKEDVEDEEEEEEMGFREDRLSSSSSSLSVHSRSSSSSSNCSRLRERAAALAEAGLIPAYRRRSHFCSSSGSNSSHGGTSPLPAAPQRQLQEIAFPYLSRVTRTRSSHSRRREDSSSGHLHRSRNRSSGHMTTAAAATPPGRVTRKYCYSGGGGPPLLQQHEDTVAIR